MIDKANIFLSERKVGELIQRGTEYTFQYDPDYLSTPHPQAISFSLPIQKEPFEFKTFPPFFDNLLPEGWLSDIVTAKFKIDRTDKFALLCALGQDGIGAVSVQPISHIPHAA